MSPHTIAEGRQFRFDLTVEIAPGMAVSGGELAESITDGLMVLDNKGLLFPGLHPVGEKHWLLGTSIRCTGYSRSAETVAVDAAYARLMAPSRPHRTKARKLADELHEAQEEVGAAIVRLRALQGRLSGLAETLVGSTSATPNASAAAARSVATAILNSIEAELKKLE